MAGILDSVRSAIAGAMPGVPQATQALGAANSAADNAQLKSYQDKYGPNNGARIYQQDQAAAKAASSPAPAAQSQGQGHMGSWADKMHPTNK